MLLELGGCTKHPQTGKAFGKILQRHTTINKWSKYNEKVNMYQVMSGCKSSYDRAILKGAALSGMWIGINTTAHSPDIAETYSNIGKDQTIRAIVSMFRNDTGLRKELMAEYNYYKLLLEKVDKDSNENK